MVVEKVGKPKWLCRTWGAATPRIPCCRHPSVGPWTIPCRRASHLRRV